MNSIYAELLSTIAENRPCAVETTCSGTSGLLHGDMSRRPAAVTPVTDTHGRSFARVSIEETAGTITIREPVLPQERLIVLGGGHIALHVSAIGARCGFEVCVVDDRPDFANSERFPEAARVLCDRFENGIQTLGVTPFDYVVVITRGHRHDADCLRALLALPESAYLGMIGSRRRTREQLRQLQEEGYDAARLQKICTPIGLNIGAETPEEIAVIIAAEMIAVRAERRKQ